MKKTNRFVALMLALLMLLQTFSFAASVSDFEDFPNDWSTEAMTAAVNSGLLIGTSETTIEPKKNLTRAEMTAIVTRAFGATVPMDISFVKDVKNTDWFYSPVALSYQMGVFNGTRADLFEPKNNIRREDVFLGLSRVLVIDEGDAAVFEQFKDKDQIDSWASGALAGMIRDDYLHGYEDSTLRPRNNITRAEVAQLFHNIIDTYVSEPGEYTQDDLNGTVLVRSKDVFIHDATIDGDLIVADGVGAGNFGMQNVHVKGRILFRGGEGVVTFKNVTADGKVIINDPNGTVNFHNYRTDVPFKDNLDERTPATFLERVPDKTPGSSGPISPSSSKITYKTQFFFADLDGNYSQTADKELSQSVKKNTYVSAPIVTALSSLVTQGKLDEEVYNNWVKGFEKDPAYAAEDETTKIDVSGIVLTRHYRRKTFDVNLYKPNGTSDVEQLTFGQTLPDPATTPDGYTFEGWSITPDMNDPEFVAPGYTVDGDTTSFYPVFAPVDDNYVSKHMLENLEGTAFDIENEPADTGKANLGATVTATVREIEGFTAGTPGTGVVTEGGVLNIVTNYTRNSYTIKFLDENGDEITSSEQSVKYEGTITDVPTVTPADDENKFTGWYYDGRTYTVEEVKEITVKGEMTFTPTIIPKNYYQYYTKYELQNVEDDLYAIDELLTQTDSAEENAVVTAKQLSEVDPDLAQHFTEVATTPDASTGAVTAPDFSLVLLRRYDRKTYRVIITDKDDTPVFDDQVKYGDTVADKIPGGLPTQTPDNGKVFDGWFDQDGNEVDANYKVAGETTITPSFSDDTADYTFVTKYFFETLDPLNPYEQKLADYPDAQGSGKAATLGDAQKLADAEIPQGFVLNTEKNEKWQGTILNDNSLVLEVYYDRVIYKVTLDNGVDPRAELDVKYGDVIPAASVPAVDYDAETQDFMGWSTDGTTQGIVDLAEPVTGAMDLVPVVVDKDKEEYFYEYYFETLTDDVYSENEDYAVSDYAVVGKTLTIPELEADKTVGFTVNDAHPDAVLSGTVVKGSPLTLSKYYSRNSYEVTVNNADGSFNTTVDVKYGDTLLDKLPEVEIDPGFILDGWYDQDDSKITEETTVDENGASLVVKPVIVPDPADYDYTINYYEENLDGTYPASPKNAVTDSDKANTVITLVEGTNFTVPTGFDVDTENSVLSGTVNVDGTMTLSVYFKREVYEVTVNNVDGSFNTTVDVKYGDTLLDKLTTPEIADGYTFDGWFDQNDSQILADTTVDENGASLVVTPVLTPNDFEYTINYYEQNLDDSYPTTPSSSTSDEAPVDTVITLVEGTGFEVPTGFDVDTENSVLSGTVNANGDMTLSVYFKREVYEVTVNNADGSFNTTVDVKYGDTLLDKLPEVEIDPGFILDGWYDQDDSKITEETTVDENGASLVVKPVIVPDPADYDYTINYYEENLDGTYPASPKNAVTDSDKANTVITLVEGTNFTVPTGFDVDTENSVLSGTVNVDGTMTLSVYFKREVYEVTVNNADSSFNTTVDVKYGDTLLDKLPTITPEYGYEVVWKNQNDAVVDADTTVDENGNDLVVTPEFQVKEGFAEYTIDTYKQPSEGAEYPATPTKETKVEEIGKEITLVEGTDFEVPTSYELDTDKSVLSGTVSASLILKIYLKVVPTPMVTVTFYDSDGVTELTAFTKEIPVGSTIADPGSEGVTVPAGQKFVGWSTDGTEANAFNFATAVTANTELYPYFTDNDNAIYTIQYYIQNINNDNYTLAENLTQTDSTSKKIGESVTITAPEIDGLTENALHADRVVTIDVLSENQDENILKLYYNRNSYEVKFIIEGKQSGDTQTLRYGATIPTIPTAPQTGSNGAPFKGWSTDETAANIVSKIEEYTVPANNVTFTAIYSLVVMFKLDADDEDKDAFKVLNDVAVDSKITAPTADEVNKEETEVDKRRRTFLGWMLEGDDEETLVDFENYPITTDTTFVAKFEQIYITVRFYDMYARPNKRLVLEVEDTYQYGDTILLSDFPQNRDGSVYGKTYNGFWKDSTLASVYTQPYQHILNFDWFNYESTTKTWSDKFIADISDTLEPGEIQEPAATQILPPEDVLDYDLYVTAKTAILSFATDKIMADGEPLAITLPAKYNSDTRALDTFKDMLFNNKRPTLLKLEVAGIEDKLLGILADKGLLKEGTREILNVDRQINFITVLGEERLNKFLDEQFEDHYEINDEQLLEEFGAELLDNILNSDEADEKLNGIFNMPAVQSAAYKLFIDVVVPLNEAALEEKLGTDALNDIYDVAKEYVLSDNEILSAQYDSFKDVIAQDYKLEVFEKFVYPDLTGIMKEYYDGLSPAGKENFINNADVDVEDISIKNKILADKTFCEKILDDAKVRTKILSNATLKRQVLVDNESTIKPLLFSDTYRSLVIPYAKDYVADNRHSIIDDYGHLLLTDDNKEYTDAIKEDYKKEVEEALVILKKELKDEDQFCVYKDTVVIVKALKDYIEKFSFERVERDYLSKIPQKALDNLPMELIRDTYFERTRLAYLDQVNAALDKAHIGIYGEENKVDSGITINFNPISEFYIPMHDYALEKYELAQDELKDRKPEFYEKYDRYVKQNPYIDELIALAKPEKLFDGTANDYTEYSSGYSIRTVENYYDEVLLPLTVLADDAFVWYCENIPQEDLQAVLDKYEEKVLYYINFLTDLLVEYDMYGIPTDLKQLIDDVMKDDMIKNDIIKVNDKVTDKDIQEYIDKLVENKTAGDAYVKVSDKIGLRLAVILEKFAESKFNRTWDEPEYTQFQEIVEFIMEEVDANVTTDYLFDKLVKGDYKEFSKKGITVGIERQLDADVTING